MRKGVKKSEGKPVGERLATRVLAVIGVSTAVFVVAQYVSFLITGEEQAILIQWYFRGIVIECGVMMAKRITEVVVGRIKKKEEIEVEKTSEGGNNFNEF